MSSTTASKASQNQSKITKDKIKTKKMDSAPSTRRPLGLVDTNKQQNCNDNNSKANMGFKVFQDPVKKASTSSKTSIFSSSVKSQVIKCSTSSTQTELTYEKDDILAMRVLDYKYLYENARRRISELEERDEELTRRMAEVAVDAADLEEAKRESRECREELDRAWAEARDASKWLELTAEMLKEVEQQMERVKEIANKSIEEGRSDEQSMKDILGALEFPKEEEEEKSPKQNEEVEKDENQDDNAEKKKDKQDEENKEENDEDESQN